MLRDRNLVPLSHQHQHVLALCVRMDRAVQAGNLDLAAWQAEIEQSFKDEICLHFAAEEAEIFPLALRYESVQPLIAELKNEHVLLRQLFARAEQRTLDMESLESLVEKLAEHIRKEERLLFETLQTLMSEDELRVLGESISRSLGHPTQACSLRKPPQ
jgi:iron-sulfur cluster repair protein YtfE (RIC family)